LQLLDEQLPTNGCNIWYSSGDASGHASKNSFLEIEAIAVEMGARSHLMYCGDICIAVGKSP
jgi:hypothetical protein